MIMGGRGEKPSREMCVTELPIGAVKPYERNPRKNRKAVDAVAASIREFGWKQPLVVDRNHVIICGHTRYLAAQKLKLATVPVVVAEDLSEDQIKAYRLADNKTGELAAWNGSMLELELADLAKVNFDVRPFALPSVQLDRETGKIVKDDFHNHREKTWQHNNFELFLDVPEEARTAWGFPILPVADIRPEHGMIAFSEVLASSQYDAGVHFFVDDYRFERCWTQPDYYIPFLKKHPFVVQPDFSLYTDMPKIMQMWNKYRNHMLAWHWARQGIPVIPNVMFSDPESYEWCFDGLPLCSTVAISNVGVMRRKEWRDAFLEGMTEAIRRLSPKRILFYGRIPKEYDFRSIEVLEFPSNSFRGKNT